MMNPSRTKILINFAPERTGSLADIGKLDLEDLALPAALAFQVFPEHFQDKANGLFYILQGFRLCLPLADCTRDLHAAGSESALLLGFQDDSVFHWQNVVSLEFINSPSVGAIAIQYGQETEALSTARS
jgi:hypothetical protein